MLLAIIAFYLVLGCFMETISMMIATTPIVVPVIVALGYDPVWWGIVFVILIEAALITPPVGLNLYIVQAVRKTGSIGDLFVGSGPFLVADAHHARAADPVPRPGPVAARSPQPELTNDTNKEVPMKLKTPLIAFSFALAAPAVAQDIPETEMNVVRFDRYPVDVYANGGPVLEQGPSLTPRAGRSRRTCVRSTNWASRAANSFHSSPTARFNWRTRFCRTHPVPSR